jgi:hypothetical protein
VHLQLSTALLESITGMQLAVRLGLASSDGQQLVLQHIATGGAAAEETETGAAKCILQCWEDWWEKLLLVTSPCSSIASGHLQRSYAVR